MATATSKAHVDIDYPTSDGRPMAETDCHRDLMVTIIQTLRKSNGWRRRFGSCVLSLKNR
jgi:hypothetical protein